MLDTVTGPYNAAGEWCLVSSHLSKSQLPKAKETLAFLVEANETFSFLRPQYEEATRPATVEDIKSEMQVLIGSRANGGVGDVRIFGRMLGEDVGAAQPPVGALEKACNTLRRTHVHMPAIAEVLGQIRVEQKMLEAWGYMASKLPERIERLRDLIEKTEADLARSGDRVPLPEAAE
ncbi:hypothetical protein [Methylopila sp. Yamaguchi]|uniref:hypothetical protein n=1 Tax=Methylopila sp. Yamaguchi TaxID=1437817 RepID=UPI001AECE610|nr:hypothetical protein [Methylopila sp. Yamaguchi]